MEHFFKVYFDAWLLIGRDEGDFVFESLGRVCDGVPIASVGYLD